MDLVTITCNRDFQFMLLQAESIQKFLEPCHHWIVINEYEDLDIEKWQNALSKFYTKHTYKILTPDDFSMDATAYRYRKWYGQQYFKLAISKFINKDYLILDTKSFFIRPDSLTNWYDTMGSGILHKFGESIDGPPWEDISLHYSKVFNTEPLTHFLFNLPFKVNIDLLKKYNRTRNLMDDLYPTQEEEQNYFELKDKKLFPSEFILYSYIAREHFNDYKHKERSFLYVVPAHVRDKNETQILVEIMRKILDSERNTIITTFALHPLVFNNLSNKHVDYINKWLTKLGLNFQFNYK
jgi:hypothetical protein